MRSVYIKRSASQEGNFAKLRKLLSFFLLLCFRCYIIQMTRLVAKLHGKKKKKEKENERNRILDELMD